MFNLTRNDQSRFTLTKGSQEIAGIKYNRQSQSIRIHSAERRLFFLSQKGLLQNRVVLKTEYGVEIGEQYNVKRNKGILHLAETKFHYSIEQNAINVLDKSRKQLVSFKLENADALDNHEISAIVFSLMWMFIQLEISAAGARKVSSLYVS